MNGYISDSFFLAFIKIVSTFLGLITTKILVSFFSLHDYGTYAQAMLIVSTCASLSIIGLTDAINYFYNSTESLSIKKNYTSTIFILQFIFGIALAFFIIIFSKLLVKYFGNPDLSSLLPIIAFMPLLENIISLFQILFISVGKAKYISFRNLIISILRLVITFFSVIVLSNIKIIILLLMILDFIQVSFFFIAFSKVSFNIRLSDFRIKLLKEIMVFSFPMAMFVITNTLNRDIDKYIIGFFADTETLAIYTNSSKVLPFDIFSSAFLTILIPVITRQIRSCCYDKAKHTVMVYLQIGYFSTWIFIAGALVISKELLVFLYDEKYLPGYSIFIIYLLVDMFRFANVSLVLSAKGKSKLLMKLSFWVLIGNILLSLFLFHVFGTIGPAFATLIVTCVMTITLLILSAQILECSLNDLLNYKEILLFLFELLFLGIIMWFVKNYLIRIINVYLAMIIIYVLYIIIALTLNINKIKHLIKMINTIKEI